LKRVNNNVSKRRVDKKEKWTGAGAGREWLCCCCWLLVDVTSEYTKEEDEYTRIMQQQQQLISI